MSAAGWGDADHIAAARRILVGQIDWIATRLPEAVEDPKPRAKEMLGLVHGALVLEVAGMTKAADLMLARAYPKG